MKATGREKCVEAKEEEEEKKNVWQQLVLFLSFYFDSILLYIFLFFRWFFLSFLTVLCWLLFFFFLLSFYSLCLSSLPDDICWPVVVSNFDEMGRRRQGTIWYSKNIHPSSCLPVRFTLLYTVHTHTQSIRKRGGGNRK